MEKAITVMFDYKDKSGYFISDHKMGRTGYPVFHVLADKYVPDERMIHVAGVAAQILDKNMNMKPDSGSLARKLRDNFAHITIHSSIMMREKMATRISTRSTDTSMLRTSKTKQARVHKLWTIIHN